LASVFKFLLALQLLLARPASIKWILLATWNFHSPICIVKLHLLGSENHLKSDHFAVDLHMFHWNPFTGQGRIVDKWWVPPQVWYDKIHFSIWETKTIENNQISYSICIGVHLQCTNVCRRMSEVFIGIHPQV
jgi:hypothetical protein